MLQTRNGKRTAMAALKFSMDMVQGEAHRLEDRHPAQPGRSARPAARPDLRPRRGQEGARSSPPACPPVPARPPARSISTPTAPSPPPSKGEKVLLVRNETSPEDLRGMIAAEGILTAQGRRVSSHAALVARQMGKVCVCGAGGARRSTTQARPSRSTARRSRKATACRSTAPRGKVYAGQLKTAPSEIVAGLVDDDKAAQEDREVQELPAADELVREGHRASQVRTNADTPGADRERHRVRRHRHRPEPHRAHVLRRRPHRRDARDDPRRQRRGPRRRRSPSCCRISATTSPASSRR